jgi:hypothetical protein
MSGGQRTFKNPVIVRNEKKLFEQSNILSQMKNPF